MNYSFETTEKEWKENESSEFLQSFDYGEFLKSLGRKVSRLKITTAKGTFQIQCVIYTHRLGLYGYIPRVDVPEFVLASASEILKKDLGLFFVRVEPVNESKWLERNGTPAQSRQPRFSWIQDISIEEEEMMQNMHKKTRYNIRLAQKKEVVVKKENNFGVYEDLNKTTTERNGFVSHPDAYIKSLLELPNVNQYTAYHEDDALASAIMLEHHKTVYYFLGASSNEKREFMAPYLLHFEIMKDAKSRGITSYDWWGIAGPVDSDAETAVCHHNYCWDKNDPLHGVSRFKAGFPGELREYRESRDIVFSRIKYWFYKLNFKLSGSKIVGHPTKKR